MLVLDGNMKNQREVCMAKDAGYTQFTGLLGSVKTGCPRTPAYKCRYCSDHMHRACVQQPIEEGKPSEMGDAIVEVILAKKITRSETYYQVKVLLNF